MELFRDNPILLKNLTHHQLLFFINQLKKEGRESSVIDFFSVLCICKGEQIVENQSFIAEQFLKESNKMYIRLLMKPNGVYVKEGNQAVPIEEFIKKSSPRIVTYFSVSIQFLADCCFGINQEAIEEISEKYPFDVVLECVKNEYLPNDLRTAFCNLMHHSYIITNSVKAKVVSFTRVWLKINEEEEEKKLSKKKFGKESQDVKEFLKDYLSNITSTDISNLPNTHFLTSVVRILKSLFSFGFYANLNEIEELIPSLVRVLATFDKKLQKQKSFLYYGVRKEKELGELKFEICSIISNIFQQRLDLRITNLLTIAKKYYSQSLNEKEELGELNSSQKEEMIGSIIKASDILSFNESENWNTPSFTEILLLLIKTKQPQLSSISAKLLVSHFNQKETLLKSLKDLQVLVSESSIETYKDVQKKLDILRNLSASQINVGDVTTIIDILKVFIKHCLQESDRKYHQKIMYNMKVHECVFELLQNKFQDLRKEVERNIITYALAFLKEFVKNNPQYQEMMFAHFDFFLKPKYLLTKTGSSFLCEVLKNNSFCCSHISERQVQMIANVIADNKIPRLLGVLETLLIVNGKYNKRNQNLVMKIFLEKANTLLILFKDPESIEKRNVMIQQLEYRDEDSIIRYYLAQLDLLTKCCGGKIYETEIKAQSIYTIEEIYQQLIDPINLREIKCRMILLMLEAFFEAERLTEDLESNPYIWKTIEYFVEEYKLMIVMVKEEIIREDIQYLVFSGISVFVKRYFENNFIHQIEKSNLKTIESMAEIILEIHETRKYEEHPDYSNMLGAFIEIVKTAGKNLRKELEEKANEIKIYLKSRSVIGTSQTIVEMESKDSKVFDFIEKFTKITENSFDVNKEIEELADIFEKNLETGVVETLIKHVTNTDDFKENNQLIIGTILCLKRILERKDNSEDDVTEELVELQKTLGRQGIIPMLLRLLVCDQESIVYETTLLAISVLVGGNEELQNKILVYMEENLDSDWFLNLRNTIRKIANEIKEIQVLSQNEEKSVENLKYYCHFLNRIFRFLQLLCEGHHSGLQNYLRVQKSNIKSYDLIAESVSTIEIFSEQNYDNYMIKAIIQMYISLTEFIQGPCEDNQLGLLSTKLCERSNLILSFPLTNLKSEKHKINLHEETLLTLLSLLEGMSSNLVPEHLIRTLDFKLLRKNLDNLEGKFDVNKKLAHRYFVLMKTLLDFETGLLFFFFFTFFFY